MRISNFSRFDRVKARTVLQVAVLVSIGALLAGCQSSRFDGGGGYARQSPPRQSPVDSDIEPGFGPGGGGVVETSPLPPAPGSVLAPEGELPGVASPGPANVVAGLGQQAEAPRAAPPAASRSSAIGRWTAREAAGNCGVTLSSTPALDLYRASTSGCANKDLQSVNAWEFRDGEVYLYARGGVVARLRDGGGQFNGVLAKSGAPLSLSK